MKISHGHAAVREELHLLAPLVEPGRRNAVMKPKSEDLPCICDWHRLRTMAVCGSRLAYDSHPVLLACQ